MDSDPGEPLQSTSKATVSKPVKTQRASRACSEFKVTLVANERALLKSLSASAGQDASELIAKLDTPTDGTNTPEQGPAPPRMHPVQQGATLDHIDQLADELDELTVEQDRYVGRGSGLHLARSIGVDTGKLQPPEPELPSLVEQVLTEEHRREARVHPLPPPDLANSLVDAYFYHYDRQWSLLHRRYFDEQIANGKLDSDLSFRSLYFSVCALGARFSNDKRLEAPERPTSHPEGSANSRGFDYFKASAACNSPLLVGATLYDMQASVLNVLWLMGAASPISAWQATGYSRLISSGLGRPLAMHDEDYDLQAPTDMTDEELDEWEMNGKASPPASLSLPNRPSISKAWIGLTKINSIVLRSLYGMRAEVQTPQKVAEHVCYLDSLLNAWLETVPDNLRWNQHETDEVLLSQSGHLFATYYNTQILIHREFLSPGKAKVAGFPSLAICSNAARSCANILDHMRKKGLLLGMFFMAPMQAITAALILLVNVFSGGGKTSDLTSSAMKDVKRCLDVLQELSETTFVARKCYVGLSRLLQIDDSAPSVLKNPGGLKRGQPEDWPDSASPGSSVPSNTSSPPTSGNGDDGGSTYRSHKHTKRENDLPMSTTDLSSLTFNGRPTFAPTSSMGDALVKSSSLSATNPATGSGYFGMTNNNNFHPFGQFDPVLLQQMIKEMNSSQDSSGTQMNHQSSGAWNGMSGSPGAGYGSSLSSGLDLGAIFAANGTSAASSGPTIPVTAASTTSSSNTQGSTVAPIDALFNNVSNNSSNNIALNLPRFSPGQFGLQPLPSAMSTSTTSTTVPSPAFDPNSTSSMRGLITPPPNIATPGYFFGHTGFTPGSNINNNNNNNNNFWDSSSLFGELDFSALADFGMGNQG
ncbi:Gypsy retrotransposon integrase-like protein 1 [Microbotryomycetes sp. JL221]|nr:Gypsy retrotransposon integrase-like protein 1 [Microbotryomycetes sp. JL221]